MWEAGCRSTSWSTKCCRATCGDPGNWFGAGATAGCGCEGIGRSGSGLGYWNSLDDEAGDGDAEDGTATNGWSFARLIVRRLIIRRRTLIADVLDEPQDLVNIAHVVRAMKNFGCRDLRLVNPREYDAHRIEGIAHQTEDVL